MLLIEGMEKWHGQVVLFFIAETAKSARLNLECPQWTEYAYARWLEDVAESDIRQHSKVDVRREADIIWKKIEICNEVNLKMMQWAVPDVNGFQCHPYTTGWGIVCFKHIQHQAMCQPVNHKTLSGFFWLNDLIYDD